MTSITKLRWAVATLSSGWFSPICCASVHTSVCNEPWQQQSMSHHTVVLPAYQSMLLVGQAHHLQDAGDFAFPSSFWRVLRQDDFCIEGDCLVGRHGRHQVVMLQGEQQQVAGLQCSTSAQRLTRPTTAGQVEPAGQVPARRIRPTAPTSG